ncbi:endolytic transglycosylase MltG [Pseudohalioglobus lutimaris]|uniref:Endolytic murein transglycosylase n=1 Tax=Pseudohalioglobus lutimaris TaxID=1737061 RepID=A0A2N5X344_9GAMM|nr:endolytic transglycosylase MltG [Pseudohalioglobus lutimaris]PLW68912.1 endolytic transglycosylase MltG [Pseudohalioglobus lutimaris]
MLKKLFLLLLLAVIGLAFFAYTELQNRWQLPLNIPQDGYRLSIGPGESLRSVAGRLRQEGIYADDWLLRAYARQTGADQQIKRGEYLLKPGTTPVTLLDLLTSGNVIRYQVTLPEGITLARAIMILSEEGALEHELSGPEDARIRQLVAPFSSGEGWFFPDTYQFERGASDWQILQRAHAVMTEVLEQEWQQRADNLPYQSPYEALIMASIVERETGMPQERGQIAGVFVRRLQRNMRLQTDPTIIYGLGEEFDGNLRRVHLRDESNPFNTYRHSGLPPTPIALPGRAAIHAALQPEDGKTLFFVARGDGGHYFSETLAEHERAVRKYQLQRRQDYRSAPGNQ